MNTLAIRLSPGDDLRRALEAQAPALGGSAMVVAGIAARAAAKLLQHEIKVYVGSSVEIELKGEGGIERSVGKAKRVVDLRKK